VLSFSQTILKSIDSQKKLLAALSVPPETGRRTTRVCLTRISPSILAKILFLKIYIIIAAAGIFLILHPGPIFAAQSDEIGIINVAKLNFRPEPSRSIPPLKILKKGTRVRILRHLEGWLEVLHKDRIGYIRDRGRYVRIIRARKEIEDNGSAPDNKSDNKSDNKIDRFKQRAEDISRKIEKSKAEVLRFTRKEAAIINSLNETDLSLNNAQKRVSSIKLELAALEKKIEETTNLTKALIKRIEISEGYAAGRLVAFYKLHWLGKLHVLASAESMYEFFQRGKAMERVLAYDENILKNLAENKAGFEKLLDSLNSQKMAKLSLETDLKKQIGITFHQKAKRSKLLEDIRNKRSLEIAAIASLKESAKALDQTIQSLNLESNRTKPVENISFKPFIFLKGLLQMPVKGKIISLFGPYKDTKFKVVNFRSGINIKADRGEPVHSVSFGQVLYSSWFKGYGNMIIIDHGNNYYTVYANVEELFKAKGDEVETGEVIATVGDTGSRIGPKLYFEVRHYGKPVDPLKWIKKG